MANRLSPGLGASKAPKWWGLVSRARGGNAAQDPEKSKIVVPTAIPETGLGGGKKKRFFARIRGLGESKSQRSSGPRQIEPHKRPGEQAGSGQAVGFPGDQDPAPDREILGEQVVKEAEHESSEKVPPADEEEQQNLKIVLQGAEHESSEKVPHADENEQQNLKIVKEAEDESSQKVSPADEEEQQNPQICSGLEHESQKYGSRRISTKNIDIDASGNTYPGQSVDTKQPAGYNPLAPVSKFSIEKEAATNEIEALRKRNKELEEQIASAENQNSRAHDAHGVYSRSEADPGLLQKVATDIKQSLTSFTAILMENMDRGLKARFHPKGIKFQRVVDIKFAIQAQLCSLVFEGLWDTDEYFFYRCLPEYADLEKSKKAQFTRYKDMKALGASGVVKKRLDGSECGQAKCKDACSCGLMEFVNFFNVKYERLMQTELGKPSASTVGLREDFVGLLSNVWLAYLLTLSFEQPATLFKVRGGQKFVNDHMDPAMEAEGTVTDTVAFMIIPGFRVGKSLIKSMVYLGAPAETTTQL